MKVNYGTHTCDLSFFFLLAAAFCFFSSVPVPVPVLVPPPLPTLLADAGGVVPPPVDLQLPLSPAPLPPPDLPSATAATLSFSFSFLPADPFFALFAHDANNRLSGMEESELLVCRPGGFVIGGMLSLAVRVYLQLVLLFLPQRRNGPQVRYQRVCASLLSYFTSDSLICRCVSLLGRRCSRFFARSALAFTSGPLRCCPRVDRLFSASACGSGVERRRRLSRQAMIPSSDPVDQWNCFSNGIFRFNDFALYFSFSNFSSSRCFCSASTFTREEARTGMYLKESFQRYEEHNG